MSKGMSAKGGSAYGGKNKIAGRLKKASYGISIVMVGVALGLSLQFARAWNEPTQAPPNGNVGAPITTGAVNQTKQGGLNLNSFLGVSGIIHGYSDGYFDGNVGIGTVSPGDKLHVSGGNILIDNTYLIRGKRADGNLANIAGMDASNNLLLGGSYVVNTYIGTGAAGKDKALTILNGGNVGIGDTSPASLFSVGNGDLFQVNSSGDMVKIKNLTYSWPAAQAGGVLTNNGSGTLSWASGGVSGSGTANYVPKWTSASALGNSQIFDNGTSVGIGDTSPASLLSVGNGDLFQVNSSGDMVKIKNLTYSWPAAQAGGVLTNNGSGTLSWSAAAGGPWATVGNDIHNTNTGNVGIGTASPIANNVLTLSRSGNNTVYFKDPTADSWAIGTGKGVANGKFVIWHDTGSTAAMVIDTARNVGIGTASPNGKLDVRAATNVNFSVRANGANTYLTSANDANSANVPMQIESSALYLNANSGGNVGIGTASPGTKLHIHYGTNQNLRIGNTGTTAYLLSTNDAWSGYNPLQLNGYPILLNPDGGGSVGIGTTSPSPAVALDVNGAANFAGGVTIDGAKASFYTQGGEGEVLRLTGNNGVHMHLENINGTFRLVNSGWTTGLFSVDQSGNASVPGNLNVGGNITATGSIIGNSGRARVYITAAGCAASGLLSGNAVCDTQNCDGNSGVASEGACQQSSPSNPACHLDCARTSCLVANPRGCSNTFLGWLH